MAGVSRRTVQRALDDGRLSGDGPRFGRYAAGLDLDEVLAVFRNKNEAKRNHAPAHFRVVQNIKQARGDWRVVFGAMAELIAQGETVDLDLVAAAFACLHESHYGYLRDFCAVVEGRVEGKFDPQRWGLRLGLAVRKTLGGFDPVPKNLSAAAAWRGMQNMLLGPYPPQSRGFPHLMFGYAGEPRRPSVWLQTRPIWDKPDSGRVWVSTPEYGEVTVGTPARLRLACLDKTTRDRFNDALAVLSAAVAVRGRGEYMRDAWPVVSAYLNGDAANLGRRRYKDDDAKVERDAKMHRLGAAKHLRSVGISLKTVADLRAGLVGIRRRLGEISLDDADDKRATVAKEKATDKDLEDLRDRPARLSKSTVARVMGVSRMTVYYWKRETAKLAALPAPRQIVFHCRECGAVVDENMDDCPECKRLLVFENHREMAAPTARHASD